MTQDQVFELCKANAFRFGFDPILILALCEQESAFDSQAVRLENGFYRKYMLPQVLATTTKVLFSTSYGLTQLMGWSLYEADYFGKATTPEQITKKLDQYMVDPDAQVRYGCLWLFRKMESAGTKDVSKGLKLYNGGADYPPKVLARYERLKKERGA